MEQITVLHFYKYPEYKEHQMIDTTIEKNT